MSMKNKKDLLTILLTLLAVLLSLLGIKYYPELPYLSEPSSESMEVIMVEVIDGDTIRVRDPKSDEIFTVRYLGIDTPELEGPAYETCFSEQAMEKNEELVSDQKLLLEFDVDRYDQFGRNLAYVFTLDEFGEKDVFVNLELAEEGYARFYLDKINTLHQDELAEAIISSQEEFLGLWGDCGEDKFNEKCLIKGNIDSLGRKYYHLPGDKYYDETIINLPKEDEWLCTIEEAEAKNFQRALRQ